MGARLLRRVPPPVRPHVQGDLQGVELHRQRQAQRLRPPPLAMEARRVRATPQTRPAPVLRASQEHQHWGVNGEVRKWRPAGADRGFTFLRYNLTLAYHRTNLLVRYGSWSASPNGGPLESLGYKQGHRIDVDIADQTWAEAPSFHDILIFNTGHWWWSSSKFDPIQSPMLFFEKGKPIIPPLLPPQGLDLTLKHMITFVNKAMRPNGLKFFSTQSPRHFEGGDWNEGGSCQRDQPLSSEEVKEFFSLDNNGTNIEVRLVNQHLMKALEQSTTFRVLNVTHMSEFRADAHPATTGGKKHDDCMHWCLPGPTDAWNDLLAASLAAIQ
uniref:Trichome birefringence-like C-terminal domain-containing protein n=1 Tax=Aegilops tauschii subsp. strangulata TaxID=200361 RepID=A0A453BFS3_AEGTS